MQATNSTACQASKTDFVHVETPTMDTRSCGWFTSRSQRVIRLETRTMDGDGSRVSPHDVGDVPGYLTWARPGTCQVTCGPEGELRNRDAVLWMT